MTKWRDWKFDYYREALSDSLEQEGLLNNLTSEQIDLVTKGLIVWIENEGLASGCYAIPNPENTEIANLKKKINELEEESRTRERHWHDGVLKAMDLDPDSFFTSVDKYGLEIERKR